MSAPESLFMVMADFDRARLFEFGRATEIPLRDADEGYLIHCALRALFMNEAPQPFLAREARGRNATVLAYGGRDAEFLRQQASRFAEPLAWSVCNLDGMASKPMPSNWPAGSQLGFEVRVCPVVRVSNDGPKSRAGAEVDVFLRECWRAGQDVAVDREQVYRRWLASELERNGAAQLCDARMVRFRRERLARSNHDREKKRLLVCERPDVIFAGTLEVRDGSGFNSLLARGLGRHRAFGFGMLLLRAVANSDA